MSKNIENSNKIEPAKEKSFPEETQKGRLFAEATLEAERYKWLESEKAGRDLGESAMFEWHRNYWRSWCRERWIEHLHGDRFWVELDSDDYGLLNRQFHDNLEMAEEIVNRIRQGGENLDIIQWASEHNYNLDAVIEVLKILDINARRLSPPPAYAEEESQPAYEKTSVIKRKRVLVVDDDEDTCCLLRELIEKEGFQCVTALSGEEAIAEIEKLRFHLFLIDLMLPGKHGAEVAWYLRRHSINTPIIAISAALDNWNEDDLYDCGFTGIMSKPFDLEQVRNLVQDLMAKSPPAVST